MQTYIKENNISKIIIVPGNGCKDVEYCNWYYWLKVQLEKLGFTVVLKEMPDPFKARRSIWLPFIKENMKCDENSIIIGHSSGAEAAMRYAEENKVYGIILVSACYTDLGIENERISGYYDGEWLWDKIKKNTQFIIQVHGKTDPFIPLKEAHHVRDHLQSEYYELDEGGHFLDQEFPELLKILKKKFSS